MLRTHISFERLFYVALNMILKILDTGDEICRYKDSIVVRFKGKRSVLSTAPICGGYRDDLAAVFNNDITNGEGSDIEIKLRAASYEEHMALVSEELGLDPKFVAGLSTAAQMVNASIRSEAHGDLVVTTVVTGGIEVNGGRVGDPATWDELAEMSAPIPDGTINIILHINVGLTLGALTRAVVTCTEAKTAAIQELMAAGQYSTGLATGSGTDGVIVVANAESDVVLTNTGNHSKLGELIGRTVKAAVKEALYLQTGLSPERQHDMWRRLERFGMTPNRFWEEYERIADERELNDCLTKDVFFAYAEKSAKQDRAVMLASLYCHLLDQSMWGLLPSEEVLRVCDELLVMIAEIFRENSEQK